MEYFYPDTFETLPSWILINFIQPPLVVPQKADWELEDSASKCHLGSKGVILNWFLFTFMW